MLDVSPTFDIRFGGLFHSPLFGNDNDSDDTSDIARLAQLVERKALNLVVVGSSPTVGVLFATVAFAKRRPPQRKTFDQAEWRSG